MNNSDTPAKQLVSTIYGMGEKDPDNAEAVIIDDCVTVHLVTIGDSTNSIGIMRIVAFERGKGHRTRALKKILETADELAVNLCVDIGWLRAAWTLNKGDFVGSGAWGPGDAAAIGESLGKLVVWYEKYGFHEEGNSSIWVRRTT